MSGLFSCIKRHREFYRTFALPICSPGAVLGLLPARYTRSAVSDVSWGIATEGWLLLVALAFISLPGYSSDLGPGDYGYMHEELHEYYQMFLGSKCPCTVGECRPTIIKPNLTHDSGMDVLVDGAWYPVPADSIKLRHGIPDALLLFPAHVCAWPHYTSGEPTPVIECVVFNGAI